MAITCDHCGREMNDRWEIEGMPGTGKQSAFTCPEWISGSGRKCYSTKSDKLKVPARFKYRKKNVR